MSRPKGSRNRKFVRLEQIEKEAMSQADFETVTPVIEEKFNSFPPIYAPEKEQKILATHTANRESQYDENKRTDTSRMELPFYLKNMPEGSDQSKLIVAAAQAALILGASPGQVAAQYGISAAKVAMWKDTLITVGAIGRRDRISSMLVAMIEQEVKSLMAISIVTSKEEWIERQNAGDLALFYAAKADRLFILLQAFGRVDSSLQQYAKQLEVVPSA